MNIRFHPLHPLYAAEVEGMDLRNMRSRAELERIRAGMDRYAVLVFRDQPLSDADQLDFAQRFDGTLHSKTGISALQKNRFGNEALTDISNVADDGKIMEQEDRRRAYSLANRLWHADATFQDPPGRYSMLHARVVPPSGANTEFADERAAYDDLSADIKKQIDELRPPFDRLFTPNARLRVFRRRKGKPEGRHPSTWCARSRAPDAKRFISPRMRFASSVCRCRMRDCSCVT